MNILGIDPGRQGALVLLSRDGKITLREVMPMVEAELDVRALLEFFKKLPNNTSAWIEKAQAMPKQGVSSMFKYGKCAGYLEAFAAAYCQGGYHLVTPQRWQKEMCQGTPGNVTPKSRAWLAAQRICPEYNFLASEKCRRPHEGIVDAYLIAQYGWRWIMDRSRYCRAGDKPAGKRKKAHNGR